MNKGTDHSADTGTSRAIAVLIDDDNAQPTLIDAMLAEAARYGTTSVRRIYGDFTSPRMGGWARAINEFAFHPQQQFAYTTGKNATDSAMIIDAMDFLHSGRLRGFCIVSSDSDFTRLATRIREQGVFVMGIGEPKTPKSFVNACEVFVRTTNLVGEAGDDAVAPDGAVDRRGRRRCDSRRTIGHRGGLGTDGGQCGFRGGRRGRLGLPSTRVEERVRLVGHRRQGLGMKGSPAQLQPPPPDVVQQLPG